MGENPKVAVLGCGAGGPTLASDLISRGFEVNLAELPRFKENIKRFQEQGGIEMTGELIGFFKPNVITTDIKEAIEDVDVVMLVARAYGHEAFVKACLPYLKSGQIFLNWTSYWFCLRFVDVLKEKAPGVLLAEGRIFPYSTRRIAPSKIYLSARKAKLAIAAMPAQNNGRVISVLNRFFPKCVSASNVLETSLQNPNVSGHTAPAILNTGYWERMQGDVAFIDYVSHGVGTVMDAQDKEKVLVGKALGIDLLTWPQVRIEQYANYGAKGETSYEAIHTTESHKSYRPKGKLSEFGSLAEDIPYGLVPIASFGDMLSVPTPTIDALIHVTGLVTGVNYWNIGFTVEKLGLAGLTPKEIVHYVTTGEKQRK